MGHVCLGEFGLRWSGRAAWSCPFLLSADVLTRWLLKLTGTVAGWQLEAPSAGSASWPRGASGCCPSLTCG